MSKKPANTNTGKQLRGGTWREIEYQIRAIDEHGDAVDVDTYPTLDKARQEFERVSSQPTPGQKAWVLERVTRYYPMHRGKPDSYKTIQYAGDVKSLVSWGLDL